MDKLIKYLSVFDWLVGTATIIYGLAVGPLWVALMGVLGLVIAWFKPAVIIKRHLEAKFLAKAAKPSDAAQVQAAEQFYASMLGQSPLDSPESPVPASATNFSGSLTFGTVGLGGSRHNVLKPPLLNLYREPGNSDFLR